MATGCGHGYDCGWSYFLYSLCSILYTLDYIALWSYAYMAIRLSVGCITIRLCGYMAMWLYGFHYKICACFWVSTLSPQNICWAHFEASRPIQKMLLGRCVPKSPGRCSKPLDRRSNTSTHMCFVKSVPPMFDHKCRCPGSPVKRFWATAGRFCRTPTQFNCMDRPRRLEIS